MSDDEFGDASFLMEVDLDAITAAAASSAKPPPVASKENQEPPKRNGTNTSRLEPSPSVEKKRKVSISPSSAFTGSNVDNGDIVSIKDLKKTLLDYFGHPNFRKGQLAVLQSVLADKRDVAVFWATGSGKSMCYQIPALYSNTITVVVSPLISLMKDQVHKLNGLTSKGDLATFLGSGQSDSSQEHAALQGDYLLIYLTPEKLLSAGFLQQLTFLHTQRKPIGLIAIDEAHCVSEWHDFRPEFRKLGQALRQSDLQQIPIMALTATAVPRVQEDICKSLQLDNPLVQRQSFDRTNLVIGVHKKDRSNAVSAAMAPLVKTLQESPSPSQQSTIVYCPTRAQVEEIANFLSQKLQDSHVQVESYHAGMSLEARNTAHLNFLTGKTTVICASVAFGMGIDKPDTRRVIHYGAPKTCEEYYQQIGRAGRDGIQAECTMYVSEADFDRYKDDFYLGGLQGAAKEAVLASLKALKTYALDASTCRRKALLDFFNETPSFGERCGTCDNCQKHATMDQNDLERDFGPVARVVLQAVEGLNEQSAGTIVDVISGKSVDSYRYRRGAMESKIKGSVASRKKEVKTQISQQGYREFLVPLVQRGFLSEATKSSNVSGRSRSWTTYSITPKGRKALLDLSVPIVLPVPELILAAERKEKQRRERVLAQLKESGVKLEKLPQQELEAGDGDVIRAMSKWNSYLETQRRNGKDERVAQLEELHLSLEKWRAETAISQQMAPGTVLAEATLLTLSYTAATLPAGMKLGEEDLIAAGVRTRGIGSLCKVIADWSEKYQQSAAQATESSGENAKQGAMQLTPGKVVQGGPWKHAVYRVQKKYGCAAWESSYNRFMEGESPQTIAMKPAHGRPPVQAKTVCNHILQAIVQGKGVDLHRLATYLPPPSASEWEQLQTAEESQGLDVVEDEKVSKSELLRPIMGDKFIDTPYNERDDEEKAKFGVWCERLEWYLTLRRIDYQPLFSSD